MTARADFQWREDVLEQEPLVLRLTRHIAEPRPQLRCPGCNSILYARRHSLCGVCGEELPRSLLFSAMEVTRVNAVLAIEKQKHRAWMAKEHWS